VLTKVVYESINGGAHGLGTDVKVGSALLGEILATSLLVLTVQMTAVDSKNKVPIAPIPIGFAVAVGIYGM
jgi:glycerol uptake facilitator-like aquaporin